MITIFFQSNVLKKRITSDDKLTLAKQAVMLNEDAFCNLAKKAGITPDLLRDGRCCNVFYYEITIEY